MLASLLLIAACAPGELKEGFTEPGYSGVEDVTQVTITPDKPSLGTDEMVRIRVRGRTDNGDELTPPMDWTADGGTITQTSNNEIYFSSTSAGSFRVVGRGRNKVKPADTTTVVVIQPTYAMVSIAVSPDPASVYARSSKSFVASGLRSDGSSASPAVSWSATGGTISAGGVYVAGPDSGNYTVTAITTDGTLSDVSAVAVTEPPSNEPQGFTLIAENSMDVVPGSATSTSAFVASGGSWGNNISNLANYTIHSDATAPMSAANVLQVRWPKGMTDGVSPGLFWSTFGATYKELYVSYRVRIPTATFENQSVGTKLLGYLAYGKQDRSNQFFLMMKDGQGAATPGPWWFIADFTSEYGGPDLHPNIGDGKTFGVGSWHNIELLLKLNDDGVANGVFKMWDNGVMTHNYSNVTMVGSKYGTMAGFRELHFAPVWGGVSGTFKTQDDIMYIDHIRVSGIRQ